MDILGQSALVVSVVASSLGLNSLSRKLRNNLVIQYAILCGVISGWALTFFLEKIFQTGLCYRIHLAFNVILAPVALRFVRRLTRSKTGFTKVYDAAASACSAVVLALMLLRLADGPFVRALAMYAPSFLFAECVRLMLVDLWRGRPQRAWIYIGALILLATAVMDHVPRLGEVIPSVGNGLLCVYLLVFSETIIHQRLLHFRALMSRVLVLIFLSAVCAGIFAAFVGWIEKKPALFALNAFVASILILMVLEPIRRLAYWATERFSGQRYRELQKRIRGAGESLSGVLDTVGLAHHALTLLEEALTLESASVFILRADESKFRRIRGLRDEELHHREILASHAVIEFFQRLKRRGETPIVLDKYLENEIEQGVSQAQRESHEAVLVGLHGLNGNIAIPFLEEEKVLGFAVAKGEADWDVLPVLYPYFAAASRVLKNMDVYVRAREKERLAALGQMSAGLAHEIRNPLGAIKGAAQVLEGEISASSSPFLKIIIEEVNRLNKVVTQFLDYSRPMQSEYSPVRIEPVLERTVELFSGLQDAKASVRLDLGGAKDLPLVRCAPGEIKQVLVNLIQNSMQSFERWVPAEGALIRVGALLQAAEAGREIILFVEDNGEGIARDNLDKIFIPFFTTRQQGTGLGLSICSKIIEAHGGRMDVYSDERKATRFLIRLPIAEQIG